jgi:hypothetical protein
MPLNDVPLATQTLGVTQPLIRGNFSTINTAFSIDHVSYLDANQGKHNQVTFPVHVGSVPAVGAPIASEIYLFNQNAAPTNVSDIWLKRGSGTAYPITGSQQADNGWTYLPSGILLKWGQSGDLAGNDWTLVDFPVGPGIPVFNNIFSVQASAQVIDPQPSTNQTTASVILNSVFATTGFYIFNRRTDGGFGYLSRCTYFAIGN